MQAAPLIPAPDAIPIAAGWLEALLLVTFIVHILLVNAVLGGTLVCAARSLVHSKTLAVKNMGKALPSLFALAVNFGVAPLLFIQMLYGHYLYTSSILMATYWISVIFLAITAYYSLYVAAGRYGTAPKFSAAFFLSAAAMLGIGFIMSNNMTLMLKPHVWSAYFTSPDGTFLHLDDPSVALRFLHAGAASIAVGGLVLAIVARQTIATKNISVAMREERLGFSIFIVATLIQTMVGTALFFAQPEHIRALFTGGSEFHTGLFLIGLSFVAMLLFQAAAHNIIGTLATLIFTVGIMAGIRALIRKAMLAPYGGLAALPVQPEYSSFFLFATALCFGLMAIGYMLKLAFRKPEDV